MTKQKIMQEILKEALNKIYPSPESAFMDILYKRTKEIIKEAIKKGFEAGEKETAQKIFDEIEKLEDKGRNVSYGKNGKKYVYENSPKGRVSLPKIKKLRKKWVK